jgi:hypothetical protein
MPRMKALARFAVLFALAILCSCASVGLYPVPTTMAPERAALEPQYRIFYDALEGEGDWVLIHPFGFVFRPDVNFVAWHPYEQGFWVPSDVYGWVWVSSEPFGWATFHYGRWLYDSFQGWVWLPGTEWAPAWVSWETAGSYIGWAPLIGEGVDPGRVPGGLERWAPLSSLGTTDISSRLVAREQLGPALAQRQPIENLASQNGVTFNRGPSIEAVERITGPLPRANIADAPAGPVQPLKRKSGGEPKAPASPKPAEEAAELRRAGVEAARIAKGIAQVGASPPATLRILRAPIREDVKTEAPPAPRKAAAPDTSRAR